MFSKTCLYNLNQRNWKQLRAELHCFCWKTYFSLHPCWGQMAQVLYTCLSLLILPRLFLLNTLHCQGLCHFFSLFPRSRLLFFPGKVGCIFTAGHAPGSCIPQPPMLAHFPSAWVSREVLVLGWAPEAPGCWTPRYLNSILTCGIFTFPMASFQSPSNLHSEIKGPHILPLQVSCFWINIPGILRLSQIFNNVNQDRSWCLSLYHFLGIDWTEKERLGEIILVVSNLMIVWTILIYWK